MKYVIDINKHKTEKIENFIKKGDYDSFAQFINVAIENQIFIEESESQIIDENLKDKKLTNILNNNDYFKEFDIRKVWSQPKMVSIPDSKNIAGIPDVINEERYWLWGQINKIFPIKIGLRVLFVLLDDEQWVELEIFRDKASVVASEIASEIRKYESKKMKNREEKISVGLPDGRSYKSITRYKSHFLAYMMGNGKFDGAMSFLRFVNLLKDEKGRVMIGITTPGISFVKMENPVIDNNNFEQSLSASEIDLYLEHINKYVRGEVCAIKWLLSTLNRGITEREPLNNEIKKEFGTLWNSSDDVINTQRAGLMARMYELGLVSKKKKGVKVNYFVSDFGKMVLEKLKKRGE
ncbi:MAG: hypothetical protein M1371_05235 [Actinobacteria bacterium]|nr:hypothetical protein [Actinomycetota bacterium]